MLSGTQQKNSSYSEGSFGAHLDYFALPLTKRRQLLNDSSRGYYLWFRVGYLYAASPPNSDDFFKEHTIRTEMNNRFYVFKSSMLTIKSMLDSRLIDGTINFRYRPRVTIEQDFKTDYLSFTGYFFSEYFFDFDKSKNNRFRFCVGSEVKVSKKTSLELYYLKQLDNGFGIPTVHAIGVALKGYFESKSYKHS